MEVALKIYRFDPGQDKKAGYDEHRLHAERGGDRTEPLSEGF